MHLCEKVLAALLSAACISAAAGAGATQTMMLPGTGSGPGGVLPGGAADLNYVVTAGPPGFAVPTPAVVYSPANLWSTWLPNDAASAWIGHSDSADTRPYGEYTFTLSFDLTGWDVGNAVLTGRWAADQDGYVLLNGGNTGVSLPNGNWDGSVYPALHPFTVRGGFVAGANTLSFVVREPDDFDGLRVSPLVLSVSPVPEPAAWTLLLLGLAGPAWLGWRARHAGPRC